MESSVQSLEMLDGQRGNLRVIWNIRVRVPLAEKGENVNYAKPNETVKN